MKEKGFPSLEGEIFVNFVNFDHVELMSFLSDCGKCLISVFWLCASFQNLIEGYLLAFNADFDLKKSSCVS